MPTTKKHDSGAPEGAQRATEQSPDYFGVCQPCPAAGLPLRRDHGSGCMSDDFQNEIRYLGIEGSPAFVRQPEGNGCIERCRSPALQWASTPTIPLISSDEPSGVDDPIL